MTRRPDIRHHQHGLILRAGLEVTIPWRLSCCGIRLARPQRDKANGAARRVVAASKDGGDVFCVGGTGVHAGAETGGKEGEEGVKFCVAVAVAGEFESAEDWIFTVLAFQGFV